MHLSLFLWLLVVPALAPQPVNTDVRDEIRNRLQVARATGQLTAAGTTLRARVALPNHYEAHGFEPAWVVDGVPTEPLAKLMGAIGSAVLHGLDPTDYHMDRLRALHAGMSPRSPVRDQADLDLLATDAFLVLGSHLLHGRVHPESFEPEWMANRRNRPMEPVLAEALRSGDVAGALENLAPVQPRYATLKRALASLRALEANGPWIPIPSGPKMEIGSRGERVAQLKERLRALGDLTVHVQGSDSLLFHTGLQEAVIRFQERHGLDADGVVGPATLSALNMTPEQRIQQIVVNMERWRWLPDDLGEEHIEVNIPGFVVHVVERGRVMREHRAIVGRVVRQTPSFTGQMSYLVLAPYWHVPPTIASQDKFPQIKNDPGAVAAQNMKLFSVATNAVVDPASVDFSSMTGREFNQQYRLRQEPGPQNALGRVKFMYPNRHNVYLHDTPSRELFSRSSRGFSSGCIRIDNPLDLAEYLLRDNPAWQRERIDRVATGTTETSIRLSRVLPVHMLYWTAWADQDGTIQFRDDIYKRDARVAAALSADAPGV